MQVAPVAVVTDAYRRNLVVATVDYGNGECLNALCGSYQTTVAKGLFLEGLLLVYEHAVIAVQLLIPLYRPEIGGA